MPYIIGTVTCVGASKWVYFTPFDMDEQAALDRLRQAVFARDADYYRAEGVETLADLDDSGRLEEEPAHSALDVRRVVRCEPDTEDAGDVRMVEGPEVLELFGTGRPSRELIRQAVKRSGDGWFPPFGRGSGCCTVAYHSDGHAFELCFWGTTGD
ncbi:hypothetical protein [Streptomyces indicus]|uniref:Uncharacterized protein n=1 Tax=Streptomyces indicus TaxID=417292 RepID=A0A1G9G0H3_9ACTN|nr:hypothetical protein [Streptomyces indicus]SDK94115.1 hypothetical protein SAMN05421806_114170 [Streptomyces indicus]